MPDLEAIIKKVMKFRVIKSNGCWELSTRTSPYGYPQIRFEDKVYLVHRISAAYYLGLDLSVEGIQACHKNECHNKGCWNPEHLYVGNNTTNTVDSYNLGNRKTNKRRKFPYIPRRKRCRT